MLKLLYWICVAVAVAAVGLFFVLGLAAATASRTSPAMVTLLMAGLPALVLALSLWLFLRGNSPLARGIGFLLAAAPLAIVLAATAINRAQLAATTNADGEMTFFTAGPQRALAEAIQRNDATAVATLLHLNAGKADNKADNKAEARADAHATGTMGMTPLVLALRQLRQVPQTAQQPAVLQLLLQAGAQPDQAAGYEQPLEMALQIASQTGPQPTALLLAAGANPNLKSPSGRPVFFAAAGPAADAQLLRLLLKHGADLRATAPNGETVLTATATARNWKTARLLLDLGADWRQGRTPQGQTFAQAVEQALRERESRGRALPHDEGLQAVADWLAARR